MREHIYSNINEAAYAVKVRQKQREIKRAKVQRQLAEVLTARRARRKEETQC